MAMQQIHMLIFFNPFLGYRCKKSKCVTLATLCFDLWCFTKKLQNFTESLPTQPAHPQFCRVLRSRGGWNTAVYRVGYVGMHTPSPEPMGLAAWSWVGCCPQIWGVWQFMLHIIIWISNWSAGFVVGFERKYSGQQQQQHFMPAKFEVSFQYKGERQIECSTPSRQNYMTRIQYTDVWDPLSQIFSPHICSYYVLHNSPCLRVSSLSVVICSSPFQYEHQSLLALTWHPGAQDTWILPPALVSEGWTKAHLSRASSH